MLPPWIGASLQPSLLYLLLSGFSLQNQLGVLQKSFSFQVEICLVAPWGIYGGNHILSRYAKLGD